MIPKYCFTLLICAVILAPILFYIYVNIIRFVSYRKYINKIDNTNNWKFQIIERTDKNKK